MRTTIFKNRWLTVISLLLSVPTAYFILISLLKYEMNVNGPFDAIYPTLESWGIKNDIGWKINLLIIFGPFVALLLTIFQFMKFELRVTKEEFLLNISVQKHWFPLLVAAFSIGLIAFLGLYFLGENCFCE